MTVTTHEPDTFDPNMRRVRNIPALAALAWAVLIAACALSGCSVVSQADQKADASRQCEARGSSLGPNVFGDNGAGGAGQSFGCVDGESVAVVNVVIGG